MRFNNHMLQNQSGYGIGRILLSAVSILKNLIAPIARTAVRVGSSTVGKEIVKNAAQAAAQAGIEALADKLSKSETAKPVKKHLEKGLRQVTKALASISPVPPPKQKNTGKKARKTFKVKFVKGKRFFFD